MKGISARRKPLSHPCNRSVSAALAALVMLSLPGAGQLRASTAVLWIPAEHSPVDDVLSRLEAGKDIRLTAALGEVPPPLAERIGNLESAGRLELAARPAGDPLIPLFYYAGSEAVRWQNKISSAAFTSDPYFLALRMSDARDAYSAGLKHPPGSFVCAPGGITPEYIPLSRALGFKWLAAGPLVSTAPFGVIDAEGVTLVPFSSSTIAPVQAGGQRFLVFDETADAAGTATRAALLAFLRDTAAAPFLTVSESLKTAVSTAMPSELAAQQVAPWSGDYTPWAALPAQTGALTAFARTRADLMLHLNARQGDYKAARAAFAEYFSVESGLKLLKLADPDPEAAKETEIELQNALTNAYRLMDKAPPGWLFSGLSDMKANEDAADKITVTLSSAAFTLGNVSRQPRLSGREAEIFGSGSGSSLKGRSRGAPSSAGGSDPYKVWKLARVGVSWTDREIVFSFSALEPAASASDPAFSRVRFDLYIDVNNRPRAGSTALLDGRAGRIFPDDAWEYALETSPGTAALYASTNKGPRKAAVFRTALEDGAFTVRMPRTALRGNPVLWGYAAFLLCARDDRTSTVADYLSDDFSNGYYYAVRPGRK